MPYRKHGNRRLSVLTGIFVLAATTIVIAEQDTEPPPPAYGPVTDQSPVTLQAPAGSASRCVFSVAEKPARITFSTFTGLPAMTDKKKLGGLWTVWGEGVRSSNGKYYVGIGDHRGIDAKSYLYEYDPATHKHRQVLDIQKLLSQRPGDWGHGKLHGRMDEMPDGSIYWATYWGGASGPTRTGRAVAHRRCAAPLQRAHRQSGVSRNAASG